MTEDPSEMTEDERARVAAAIDALRPVPMRRLSDGRIVHVDRDRVGERLESGLYERTETDQQPG